jgi:hypothetical protein
MSTGLARKDDLGFQNILVEENYTSIYLNESTKGIKAEVGV